MTISFSYAYLNGLLRLMARGRSASSRSASSSSFAFADEDDKEEGDGSPPVVMAVQRATREMSPRSTASSSTRSCQVSAELTVHGGSRRGQSKREEDDAPFMRTVSATSSALWPVTMWSTSRRSAPRSSACRRKTPQ